MRAARIALFAALAAAGLALAQGTPPQDDRMREIPLELGVGEKRSLCPCPVSGLMCDDPSLVKLVEDPAGQSLVGVKAGTTVCSLQGPNRIKRMYRVTVTEPPPEKKPGQGSQER